MGALLEQEFFSIPWSQPHESIFLDSASVVAVAGLKQLEVIPIVLMAFLGDHLDDFQLFAGWSADSKDNTLQGTEIMGQDSGLLIQVARTTST